MKTSLRSTRADLSDLMAQQAGSAAAAPVNLILRPHAVKMSAPTRKGARCGKRTFVIVLPIALTCTASPDLMLHVEVALLLDVLVTLSSNSSQ